MAASHKTRDENNQEKIDGLFLMPGSHQSYSCSQAFSPGQARLFARAEPTGTLRLWDTETGALKHEYSPNRSAVCCCLAWAPNKRNVPNVRVNESPAKKKKRKSEASQLIENSDILAVGTTTGSITLYHASKSDLTTNLLDEGGGDGHTGRVTGMSWSSDVATLFSCSLDAHIIMWNVASASIVHKWKGDKSSLFSIHVCHTQNHLLTASNHIKLWDLHTRLVLKTFVGHTSPVFSLYMVPASNKSSESNGADESLSLVAGSYIVSAAANDKKLNVWHVSMVNSDDKVINEVTVSFTLQETPTEVHVRPASENEPFQLAVLTQSGNLSLFEHVLNGQLKKSLKPRSVVQLATNETSKPVALPIVASSFVDNSAELQIVIAYDDSKRPVFEKLQVKDLQPGSVCLLRDKPNSTSESSVNNSNSNVSDDLTVMALEVSLNATNAVRQDADTATPGKKRRKKQAEMTLEERLKTLETDASKSSIDGRATSKSDSIPTILELGLQSNDRKTIQDILQRSDSTVIRNTVNRLSSGGIILLIKELTRRMRGNALSQHTVMQWVNITLTQHKAFLTSLPDAVALLQPLQQAMFTPTELLQRLLQVNVQLKSFLAQGAGAVASSETNSLSSRLALNADQAESSGDEMDFEELNHDVVVSEEEWENMDDSNAETEDENKDNNYSDESSDD